MSPPIRGVAEHHSRADSSLEFPPPTTAPVNEQEQLLRSVADALSDVVLLTDESAGEVFFVNASYEQVWGRARAELYANPLALIDGVHPDDRGRVHSALRAHSNEGHDIEFRVLRPAGDERAVRARSFSVRGAGGMHRVAYIIEDITERKQIARSHEQLIRGFTHDVKNPLSATDGYLALLELGVYGPLSEPQLQSIGHARRSIRSALSLVAGLLEIERAEAGKLDLERERVDLGAIVLDVVEEFGAAADAKHLGLTPVVPAEDDAIVVESDAARVRQILANLVSNAVKYTQPDGWISVTAYIELAGETPWPGRWAAVAVADNGPGIPPEKQSLVFREFTRFDPSAVSGSGIGLAISRRLARALGGELTFTSAPGVGSTFIVWLPLDPRQTS